MEPCFLVLAFLASSSAVEAQSVLFQDDFENGIGAWTVEQLGCGFYNCNPQVTWQVIDATHACSGFAAPFPSGTRTA